MNCEQNFENIDNRLKYLEFMFKNNKKYYAYTDIHSRMYTELFFICIIGNTIKEYKTSIKNNIDEHWEVSKVRYDRRKDLYYIKLKSEQFMGYDRATFMFVEGIFHRIK